MLRAVIYSNDCVRAIVILPPTPRAKQSEEAFLLLNVRLAAEELLCRLCVCVCVCVGVCVSSCSGAKLAIVISRGCGAWLATKHQAFFRCFPRFSRGPAQPDCFPRLCSLSPCSPIVPFLPRFLFLSSFRRPLCSSFFLFPIFSPGSLVGSAVSLKRVRRRKWKIELLYLKQFFLFRDVVLILEKTFWVDLKRREKR